MNQTPERLEKFRSGRALNSVVTVTNGSVPNSNDFLNAVRRCGRSLCHTSLFRVAGSRPDNYEIQVYGSETQAPRSTMVELHSNFTADSSKTVVDGMLPTNHAQHETVELTHGINDWRKLGSTWIGLASKLSAEAYQFLKRSSA